MTREIVSSSWFLIVIAGLLMFGCEGPYPSLWKSGDHRLQEDFEAALRKEFGGEFKEEVGEKRIGIALVDITDLDNPRVAQINGNEMIYAASLPKIAILLGAFVEIEQGRMTLDKETREVLTRMIRVSSNEDATKILHRVGFQNLADILQSKRYRLYDPIHNGGLWVGRDYGGGEEWQRDPLHDISHGATAMQTARFYYLAITGRLVAPEWTDDFLNFFADPGIRHKFVRGLTRENPDAVVYRKSGTWRNFHADSGIVLDDNYMYILTAISENRRGEEELQRLVRVADELMQKRHGGKP